MRHPKLLPKCSGVMTVNDAARLAKLTQPQRQQILAGIHNDPDQSVRRVMRKVLVNSVKQAPASDRQGDSRVEILCGDCLKVMHEKIEDGSVNAIVTSPPFNRGIAYHTYDDNRDKTEFSEWLDQIFHELHRVLHDDGSFFLTVGHAPKAPWAAIQMAEIAGKHFRLQNQIIWVKSITVNETSHGHFSPIQGERFLNRAWDYVFISRSPATCRSSGRPSASPTSTIPTSPEADMDQRCDVLETCGSFLMRRFMEAKTERSTRQHFHLSLRNAA